MSTAVVLSAADFQAVAVGDRFRNVLDLVKLIGQFDLTQVGELIKAVKAVGAAQTLDEKVVAGLQVLRIVASMTPTPTDDKLLAALDSVLSPEVIAILARIVGGLVGQAMAQDVTITAIDRQTASAKGIPWSFLVQVALQIVQLLQNLQAE